MKKKHCSFWDTAHKLTNTYLIQCFSQVILPSSSSPHCHPSIPPFGIFSGFCSQCVPVVLHGDCHCCQSRSFHVSVHRSLSGCSLSGASHRALPWELKWVSVVSVSVGCCMGIAISVKVGIPIVSSLLGACVDACVGVSVDNAKSSTQFKKKSGSTWVPPSVLQWVLAWGLAWVPLSVPCSVIALMLVLVYRLTIPSHRHNSKRNWDRRGWLRRRFNGFWHGALRGCRCRFLAR